MRSLIRGCPNTMTGGACGVTDSCLGASCHSDVCWDCVLYGGPGHEGCYWDAALVGPCTASWSSSSYAESATGAWRVSFHVADVYASGKDVASHVCCVHRDP